MDTKHLRSFVRVAELGSISRAASFLKMNQPALSKQLHHLEEEVGGRLLTRNGRGVTLTRAGEQFLQHARNALFELDKGQRTVIDIGNGKSGRVTLGMPAMMSSVLTVPLVRRMREELHDAEVSVVHGTGRALQELLLTREIDVAIMSDLPSSPLLEAIDLVSVPIWLVGADRRHGKQSDITLPELAGLPMIVGTRTNSVRGAIEEAMRRNGLALDIVFEVEAFEPRIELTREGFGYTIASTWSLLKQDLNLEGLTIRRIADDKMFLSAKLVQLNNRPRTKIIQVATSVLIAISPILFERMPVPSGR